MPIFTVILSIFILKERHHWKVIEFSFQLLIMFCIIITEVHLVIVILFCRSMLV